MGKEWNTEMYESQTIKRRLKNDAHVCAQYTREKSQTKQNGNLGHGQLQGGVT